MNTKTAAAILGAIGGSAGTGTVKYRSREHYQRMAALSWKDKRVPLSVRFWSKVKKSDSDKCWTWTGCKCPMGYGRIRVNLKTEISHRIAWELTHGKIKDDLCVLHRCDNPPCCNPSHLFLGTRTDNSVDKCAKGRARGPFGQNHPYAKLTEEKVKEIRSTYVPFQGGGREVFASKFGISVPCLNAVLAGKSWRHVKGNRAAPHMTSRGERSGTHKLVSAQVLEIRRIHAAQILGATKLAKMFGVSRGCIQAIIKRENWKHI